MCSGDLLINRKIEIDEFKLLDDDEYMSVKGVVGKKGELFPPKRIRELIGLKSGDKVIYRVEQSKLIVEPVPDLVTALKLPKFAKTTVKEFEKERKELAEDVSER
jgi:AbrB family looped-hinge helix DNA binding protein